MTTLINIDEFCKDLPEVTSSKMMDKKRFHPDGLFSEQIFGPVKNFTCQCGTFWGISKSGAKCKECGVDIVSSNERRKRFAKIKLPIPILNPIFADLIFKIGHGNVQAVLNKLISNEKSILFELPGGYSICPSKEFPDVSNIPSGSKMWEMLDAIYELVNGLSKEYCDESPNWMYVKNNIDKLFINYVIVLPPDLRPAVKTSDKNNQIVDQINRFYRQILTKKEFMKNTVIDVMSNKKLFYDYFRQINKDIQELYKHILDKMSKKEGLIRGNILGKRVDFSGRAVIIPDPTLTLDECVLPYLMFLELFKIKVAKRLIELSKFKLVNNALDFVDECITKRDPCLLNICEEISKDEVCILNRQPSLHRLNLLGFKCKVFNGYVIKIHPMICSGFNADFDGDQMAVYIPISNDAKQEIRDRFLATKNLSNPTNGKLTTIPAQDIVLGIFILTSNKIKSLLNEVEYKGEKITESMKIFNECFPKDFPVINYPVDKKILLKLLNIVKDQYDEETISQILDKIKMTGFKYTTMYGSTMSLKSCYVKDANQVKEKLYESDIPEEQLARISSKETESFLRENFKHSDLIESGARGSWDQARQIVLSRGFVSDFNGQIKKTPIKGSLFDGLDQREFFDSTYGCRKGLLDVALNTGASGYLSRKLIFTSVNLQIDPNLEDCGTEDTLTVFVDSEKKAELLLGRYIFMKKNGKITKLLITESNYTKFVKKVVTIRSPIFCKSENICKTCYGELYNIHKSKFVGVIAAQALGECNTQLVLRTFHTSGVAMGGTTGMKQEDIVGDLITANRLLHLSHEYKQYTYKDLIPELFDLYNRNGTIHHVHFECIISQMMWVGYKKWRLTENRDKFAVQYRSVQTVPSYEGCLVGMSFSDTKKNIIDGVLHDGIYKGIMDKILCGEKLD